MQLSRNNLNTLRKIAFNVFLIHLFATKFVSNESWIVSENTYRSESQEETIVSQHFSSLFVVLLGVFSQHLRPVTLTQIYAPSRAKWRLSLPPKYNLGATAMNSSSPCLGTNLQTCTKYILILSDTDKKDGWFKCSLHSAKIIIALGGRERRNLKS